MTFSECVIVIVIALAPTCQFAARWFPPVVFSPRVVSTRPVCGMRLIVLLTSGRCQEPPDNVLGVGTPISRHSRFDDAQFSSRSKGLLHVPVASTLSGAGGQVTEQPPRTVLSMCPETVSPCCQPVSCTIPTQIEPLQSKSALTLQTL